MNENKDNFLVSWQKDLEKISEQLKKEKQEEKKDYQNEIKEIIKKELTENEKKILKKIRKIYYWNVFLSTRQSIFIVIKNF